MEEAGFIEKLKKAETVGCGGGARLESQHSEG